MSPKITLFACSLLLGVLTSPAARAQLVDSLAATSFDYYPSAANGEQPGETQINAFRASAGVPIEMAKRTTLIAAAAYEMIDVHASATDSFQLHAPKATVGVLQGFDEHWGMMAFVDAGVASELAYSNLTLGPKVTFNFNDWCHLDLYGAGAVYRRYELFQSDESLARYPLSPVLGYGARFWVAPSGW